MADLAEEDQYIIRLYDCISRMQPWHQTILYKVDSIWTSETALYSALN